MLTSFMKGYQLISSDKVDNNLEACIQKHKMIVQQINKQNERTFSIHILLLIIKLVSGNENGKNKHSKDY